jgi:hypothetical protein
VTVAPWLPCKSMRTDCTVVVRRSTIRKIGKREGKGEDNGEDGRF